MKSVFLLCLAVLCLTLSWESHRVVTSVDRTLADLRLQVSRAVDGNPQSALPEDRVPLRRLLIAEVDSQASGIGAAAFDQVKQLCGDLFSEIANWRTATAEQITGIRADTLTAVSTVMQPANDLVAELKPILDNAAKISKDGANITKHVADALPPFTDCAYYDETGEPIGGNQDCAFNRFQGASKAFERMMLAGADAAPKLAQAATDTGVNIAGITKDAHTATTEFVRPKTTKEKITGMLPLITRIAATIL